MLDVTQIRFFHSFDEPEPITGVVALELQKQTAEIVFSRYSVAGKTVLDIGAWDGFYSYEAERRGAARVLATDHFSWSSGRNWGSKAGFDYLHAKLNSKVESFDVDVFDLDPSRLGTFDAVLFMGVLYHLPNPLGGLEKAAAMCSDCLIVESHTDMNDSNEPVMRYYVGDELNDDPTNFWGPNVACIKAMLRDMGFNWFAEWAFPGIGQRYRAIIHARR